MQKIKFYLTLLALTLGMASSINALAQVSIPTPAGRWTFENTSDLLKKEGGGMSLTPCTVSGMTVTTKDNAAQANITATTGSTSANKAVTVPAASALKVMRESSAVATRNYTIMMDIKMTNATTKCISLLQTNPYNNNDGDLFVNSGKIGQNAQLGTYSGEGVIGDNTWYRIVLACRNDGYVYVYVNGTKVLTSTKWNNAYEIDPWGFFLFCDEDGEAEDVQVAEVAYWETGLSDAQVAALSTYKSYICDGVTYDISSAAGLKNLADFTNAGYNTVNARLVSDVSMSGESWPKPIGDWSTNDVRTAYKGHFDGQGHTISNLTYATSQDYHGLFGVVSSGAVIENFTISGTITNTTYNRFGTIGYARDNGVSLRNIHSCLDIINTGEQKTIGGILGHVYNNSTVSIDRCTYSGTLQVTDTGGDDGMYGGILGHAYNNANAKVSITNCLFDGKVTNTVTGTSGCTLGGIVGWLGTYVSYSIDNCLSVGDVSSTVCGQISGALMNNGISFSNNYYKGAVANGSVSKSTNKATSVTDGQLASGEVAVKLGGAYGQTLGSDAYPVLDASAPKVYEIAVGPAGYASFVPEANILAIPTGVTAYAGQKKDGYIQLEQVSELPADNAVVVKANEGTYYCNSTDEARTLGTSNDLTFSETGIAADGSQYILANVGGLVGFYQATTGTIPARKAYFISTNGVKAFYFAEEEETAISRPTPNPSRQGWEVYDLAGRKVQVERCKGQENSSQLSPVTSQLKKGIYIVNGKKVLK